MHEDVLPAAVALDESEAFVGVEPLDRPDLLRCGLTRRRVCGPLWLGAPGWFLRCGAGIDADDLGYLWSLWSRPDADLQRRTWRYIAEATALEHTDMQEGVAGAIGKLHEPEPLVGIVPLDGRPGWRGGGHSKWRGAGSSWRRCKIARRQVEIVVVETTATGRTKIPRSAAHVSGPWMALRAIAKRWDEPYGHPNDKTSRRKRDGGADYDRPLVTDKIDDASNPSRHLPSVRSCRRS